MFVDGATCSPLPVEEEHQPHLQQLLLSCVIEAFPGLAISVTRLESSGGDHLLLIADERYAFRFPRNGQHGLAQEIKVLRHLTQRTDLPVPHYEFVDPANCFAGYRFLTGNALTPARFARLATAAQTSILGDVVALLRVLHRLDTTMPGSPTTSWSKSWAAAEFADRAISTRLPMLAARLPSIASAAQAFFADFRADEPDRLTMIHGDLVPEHILIDDEPSRLSGVIDFGDVALGDPAQDLAGLWAYGAEAALQAIHLYDENLGDPKLVTRSRNHFIRYRFDRLFEQLAEGIDPLEFEQQASELVALLSCSSVSY